MSKSSRKNRLPAKSNPVSVTNQHSIAESAQVHIEKRSGPLPHPADFEHYDQVLPGAAERIMAMAETQSNHRQGMELQQQKIESRNSFLGILCAFCLGLVGIIAGAVCIYNGREIGGSALAGTSLASLVTSFIYGTKQRQEERKQRFEKLLDKS
jgi:uncharacterized membrane protein